MKLLKNNKIRVFILIMGTLFVSALIAGYFYYDYINKSVDPRVIQANIMYSRYNDLTAQADFNGIFKLMDSIEDIYRNIPHYKNSYEIGVVYNNRAATYIAMALQITYNDSIVKDSLLNLAKQNSLISIEVYSDWLEKWQGKNKEEIKIMIKPHFEQNDKAFTGLNVNRYINNRTNLIAEAQYETPRRLSVSYTNLGIVLRHEEKYDEAAQMYFKALELWPDNLAAENNLSILLDKPIKKQGILRRLFPKDRRIAQ